MKGTRQSVVRVGVFVFAVVSVSFLSATLVSAQGGGKSGGGNGQLESPDTTGFGDMGLHKGGVSSRPDQQSDTVGTHGGGGKSGGGNGQLESPHTGGFGNMGKR